LLPRPKITVVHIAATILIKCLPWPAQCCSLLAWGLQGLAGLHWLDSAFACTRGGSSSLRLPCPWEHGSTRGIWVTCSHALRWWQTGCHWHPTWSARQEEEQIHLARL